MLNFKNILYPTDFSEFASQGLDQALLFAKLFDAKLHVLHVVVLNASDPYNPAYHFPSADEISKRLGDLADSQMAGLLERHSKSDFEILEAQTRGISAGPAILEYAAHHEIDLIVMGTHGRRGAKRLILGSVTEEVMRSAECPVLTCRGRSELHSAKPAKAVLVAVDFSENSKTALTLARKIASLNGAELHVAHVLESRHHPGFYGPDGQQMVPGAAKARGLGEVRLRQFADELSDPEVPHAFHISLGRAASEILSLAETIDADLIVAGSQGFDPLADLIFGSTAEGIVRQAKCPVFTVKKPRSETPNQG